MGERTSQEHECQAGVWRPGAPGCEEAWGEGVRKATQVHIRQSSVPSPPTGKPPAVLP